MNIEDIDDFSREITSFVFETIKNQLHTISNGLENLEDSQEFISHNESLLIIEEVSKNKRKISQKKIEQICDNISKRIFSNFLSKLSINGYLDCAWSDTDNSFVFRPTEEGIKKGVVVPKTLFIFKPPYSEDG